ncbi:universal stress protein, partial [Streptomyces sp. MCAF7]
RRGPARPPPCGPSVVVLPVHRRAARLGMQLGPVTHAVLHHSHCPVVLVPIDRPD